MERDCICAIGVMAKAPMAGRSKTRLCPPLLPAQAAALSAAFLRDVTDALLREHLAAGTGLLLADGSPAMPPAVRGFGRCLLHAMQGMFTAGFGAAIVLNSDSPTLPTSLLATAAFLLLAPGERVVLGLRRTAAADRRAVRVSLRHHGDPRAARLAALLRARPLGLRSSRCGEGAQSRRFGRRRRVRRGVATRAR
jgi:hypothetical protein